MQPWLGFAVAGAFSLGLVGCGDENQGLSTAEISERAKEHVREELGLGRNAALFTDISVPGYEDGELVVCGSVSGQRENGALVARRRFIMQLEPARWVAWEREPTSEVAVSDFPDKWSAICLRPDDRSTIPAFPE